MLSINIITLFPSFFDSPLKNGVLGRAIQSGFINIRFVNPRDFTKDKHKTVDDSPFGGGDGMVMAYEPLKEAVNFLSQKINTSQNLSSSIVNTSIKNQQKIIYLSPQGKKWNYVNARLFAQKNEQDLTFICGRYAGIDQRFISEYVDEEISIGDYVLSGGEPAMVVILDSLSRFIKGTLGNKNSVTEDSFEYQNLLEAPQWTRPQEISGYKIPNIILSGHHKNIKKFRYLMSVLITAIKKPHLLASSVAQTDLPEAIKMVQSFSTEELKACGINRESLKLLNTY